MKPDFKDVMYDRHTIRWGLGNSAVGLQCIARIRLKEPSKKELLEEKRDYNKVKAIYDTDINKGQRFKPAGKGANANISAKITFINPKTQIVSWKQDNMTPKQIKQGMKPAAGKWLINNLIALVKAGNIEFIK